MRERERKEGECQAGCEAPWTAAPAVLGSTLMMMMMVERERE